MGARELDQIDTVIIHCLDTYAGMNTDVATVTEWHKARGFDTIGYHYLIKRDGKVKRGRPDDVVGAHAKGYNTGSLGIAMAGGKGDDDGPSVNFTHHQWKSLQELCVNLKKKYNAKIIGHNEVSDKTCPNFDVQAWQEGLGL